MLLKHLTLKNVHTGESGKIGVYVAKNVEEECPTERESVFPPNAPHLITRHVKVVHMKKRNVMKNAVLVSHFI